MRDLITPSELRRLLDYDPATGLFTWKMVSKFANKIEGRIAGWLHPSGHIYIEIKRVPYKAHRLAWLYVHGVWPADMIDHSDGDGSNNRISNLREATRLSNAKNRKLGRDNRFGYKGVHWHQSAQKWRARIRSDGKTISLGLHDTAEAAGAAYWEAAQRLHGEFARVA